jgi:hypothetical protein
VRFGAECFGWCVSIACYEAGDLLYCGCEVEVLMELIGLRGIWNWICKGFGEDGRGSRVLS